VSRPTRAVINTGALRRNLAQARAVCGHARVMAIIKADGYGHGLVRAARALSAADGFGITLVEEGVALREAGIRGELFLLEGFFNAAELADYARFGLTAVVHHESQLAWLERGSLPGPLAVWVKIDTGMNRLGFEPAQLGTVLHRLGRVAGCSVRGVMSHLACADEAAHPATATQIARFDAATAGAGLPRSLANSAGLLAWPTARADWVRPGIMLYGANPLAGALPGTVLLEPAMELRSSLIAVRTAHAGEAVGYGGTFVCPADMPVGVVACGYGDGYPRHVPAGTPVYVDGVRVPLIGRVSMDMVTVDLRGATNARVGAPVELWGRHVPVAEVAAAAGTIPYELLCGVSTRVPRMEEAGDGEAGL